MSAVKTPRYKFALDACVSHKFLGNLENKQEQESDNIVINNKRRQKMHREKKKQHLDRLMCRDVLRGGD